MARTTLIYGVSTSRKTSQVKAFSQYIYERTGKPTYYMTGDGGSWGPAQDAIEAGLIRPLRISSNVVPLSTIRKISQGYWAEKGEIIEIEIGPDGKAVLPNMVSIDWSQCGGLFIEGLTAVGQMVKNYLADKGVVLGEEPVGKFGQMVTVDGVSGQETFANNSRAHFNFVQNFLYGIVMNFASLPCDMVVITALEKKGEDGDDNKATIIGPDVPGKAITGTVPAWFWNVINHQKHNVQVEDKDAAGKVTGQHVEFRWRAHFVTYPDPDTGIAVKCKTSLSKTGLDKLQGSLKAGWYSLDDFSLADYLRLVDGLNVAGADELREWRRKMDEKLGRKREPVK